MSQSGSFTDARKSYVSPKVFGVPERFAMLLEEPFLRFAGLNLLQFSLGGTLKEVYPEEEPFWGWERCNLNAFLLERDFLKPNQLTSDEFQKFPEMHPRSEGRFCWKDPGGRLSPPCAVIWKRGENGTGKTEIWAIVRKPGGIKEKCCQDGHRKYYLQALHLPGLLHNINGPIGTVIGRIELLGYKYPDIPDIPDIVRIGNQLQRTLRNASFKVASESTRQRTAIHLNRLLNEEINFLSADLFFKHRVDKIREFAPDIPEFRAEYRYISGIVGEMHLFFRKFVYPDKNYRLTINSFYKDQCFGFRFDLSGYFLKITPEGMKLPVEWEGNAAEIVSLESAQLDVHFLKRCMEGYQGYLKISCQEERCCYTYKFSPPGV